MQDLRLNFFINELNDTLLILILALCCTFQAKHLKIVTDLKKQNKELLEQSKIFSLGDRNDYEKTQK